MKKATLKDKEERRLLRGHKWAYRNEFKDLPPLEDGEVVDVVSAMGRQVGRGIYQAQGGIAVRLLTGERKDIDDEFLKARINRAKRFRDRLYPESSVYRWVFGESDGLPGFVADRFGAVVSVQASCVFYWDNAEAMASAFLAHAGVDGVRFEFSGKVREFGTLSSPVEIDLDGLRLRVDVDLGQKTGMFLDQRENAKAIRSLVSGWPEGGPRVLDGHCYMGLWSCHAAQAGAANVLGVDTAAAAIEMARQNASLNGLSKACKFECVDIAEVLRRDERYDIVVLDPPALVKSRSQREKAMGLYQALNRDAMKVIEPGGFLVTSSCSHFVGHEDFMEMLKRAARAAQREAWILDTRGAAPDHPVLMAMSETGYLTCATLRIF